MFQPGGAKPYPNKQPGCLSDFDFFACIYILATGWGIREGGEGGGGCGGGGEGREQFYITIPARMSDFI